MPTRPPVFRPAWTGSRKTSNVAYEKKRNRTPGRKLAMSPAWRKARAEFLDAHPWCCYCAEKGLRVPATCVDHIIAHKGDATLFWSTGNWAPACGSCNSRKAASSEGGFGNARR